MAFTLITGASSGIGAQFARQFAEKNHSLVLVARSEDILKKMASDLTKEFGIEIEVIALDLGKTDSAEKLFKECQNRRLEINLLVNDAGIGCIGEFEGSDLCRIEEMMILNTITPTKLIYLLLPQLKENKGSILNVASQVSFEPAPYMAAYGGTKAYMLSLTSALRVELEKFEVKVVALCPGPTYTKFFERAGKSPDDIQFKFREAEEVARAGIEGLETNKDITIPGWENNIFTFFTNFIPNGILSKISSNMVKR